MKRVMENLSRTGRAAAVLCVSAALAAAGGCDVDSFLDPSEVGRYENTPVVLPILERLDVIEEPTEQIPGISQITSEDLIPEIREYVMGPGDTITVSVLDLIDPGVESFQTRRINELGYIRLPVIGRVEAAGHTASGLEEEVADILDPDILRDPTVTVIVQEGMQRTFSILGATGSGTYTIRQNNFRLLDAVALAGGMPPGTEEIYIIRQVPLNEVVEEGYPQPEPVRPGPEAGGEPEPGAEGADPEVSDPGALIEDLTRDPREAEPGDAEPADPGAGDPAAQPGAPGADPEGQSGQPAPPMEPGEEGEGRFINVNGEWVWVRSSSPTGGDPAAEPLPSPEELVTQRVIEVDAEALQRGEARYNIVVRPGDVIRIPPQISGNIYIGGSIGRPGVFALPGERSLTLKQLVMSAGGLAPTAIPERVDLIRRLGDQQEATVRLNLRAIFEGVQPDIFLKPDDTINIGTNVFASHLAVIRNSFRFSYGFGFLMDRNFGSDVFGAAPDRRGGSNNF